MTRLRGLAVVCAALTVLTLSAPGTAGAAEPVPAAPRPAAEQPLARRIGQAVRQAMAGFSGEYSVALEDLSTGQRWLYNADRLYHPASTLKVAVALYALEQYRSGTIGWQDLVEYTEDDFEDPAGLFAEAEFGASYPVGDLVDQSLKHSSNIAVNMLGRRLGWGNIERWTASIGGPLTHENRLPRASALSVLQWWHHLDRLAHEDPAYAELLLEPLRDATYRERITAGLPADVPHLHKYGSYDGNYHDSGIVYADTPYALVVLTEGAPVSEADRAIARLSTAVYQAMTGRLWIEPVRAPIIECLLHQFGMAAY
ncbi:serine hydrolase [Symbiobacterium terraclitae]|uniref:serine hydrolase n=1 Tax=Symbiobacterium terraclitae TaxID=557451 RepID=UPI0035B5351C